MTVTLEGYPISGGSKIPKGNTAGWNPSGLDTDFHDRTHLLAREFGGKGTGTTTGQRNRVIGFRSINQSSGAMRLFEFKVRERLEAGEIIQYAVSAIYPVGDSTFIAEFIVMEAYSDKGTHMIEVIPNVP